MITHHLENTSIFSGLSPHDLTVIGGFCVEQSFDDGDVLIHENESENFDIFVLCDGSLEIVSNNSADISNEVVISERDNDLVGEVGWLTRKKRTATVRARGSVHVIRVDGEALQQYVDGNPRSGLYIMRSIALSLSYDLTNADNLLKQILWNNII